VGFLLCLGCDESGPGIPQSQIEAEWHQAICAREVRCGRMPDVDTCLGATNSPVSAQLAADLASGKVGYSPQGGRALVDGVTDMPCGITATTSPATTSGSRHRLEAAFRGGLGAGAACSVDEQCAPPAFCDPVTAGGAFCGGKCFDPPAPKPRGGVCADPGGIPLSSWPLCDDSSYCTHTGAGNAICTALPTTPGSPCGDDACGGGLACVPNNGNRECEALAAPGAPCDTALVPACDDPTTYCDSTTKTCLPRAPVGAPCSVFDQSCVAFAACDAVSDVCVALAGAGGSCQELGIECLGDLRCADATSPCALPAQPPSCP
jgi:hypothetical protein